MTAAVLGLRKVDNYEHVLALANKDERPQGLISVGLQREATKMNNKGTSAVDVVDTTSWATGTGDGSSSVAPW